MFSHLLLQMQRSLGQKEGKAEGGGYRFRHPSWPFAKNQSCAVRLDNFFWLQPVGFEATHYSPDLHRRVPRRSPDKTQSIRCPSHPLCFGAPAARALGAPRAASPPPRPPLDTLPRLQPPPVPRGSRSAHARRGQLPALPQGCRRNEPRGRHRGLAARPRRMRRPPADAGTKPGAR